MLEIPLDTANSSLSFRVFPPLYRFVYIFFPFFRSLSRCLSVCFLCLSRKIIGHFRPPPGSMEEEALVGAGGMTVALRMNDVCFSASIAMRGRDDDPKRVLSTGSEQVFSARFLVLLVHWGGMFPIFKSPWQVMFTGQ